MSVARIVTRVARVEQVLSPRSGADRGITLEELYRPLWRRDKAKFLEIAHHTEATLLIPQFEREDAVAAEAERRSSVKESNYRSRLKQRAAGKARVAR